MRKSETIKISFHKYLYPPKAIEEAINAYKNLAKISVKKDKKYIRIYLSNIESKLTPIIKDEFCNYVLSLIKITS